MPKVSIIDITLLHKDGSTRIIYRRDLGWNIQRYRLSQNSWTTIWRTKRKATA